MGGCGSASRGFQQSEFGKIILPFTVLRRLECVLEPTREAVLEQYEAIKDDDLDPDLILPGVAGAPFYEPGGRTFESCRARHISLGNKGLELCSSPFFFAESIVPKS